MKPLQGVAALDGRETEQISWAPGPFVRCVTPNQSVKYVQASKKAGGVNRCTVMLKSLMQFSLNRASRPLPTITAITYQLPQNSLINMALAVHRFGATSQYF